MVVQVTPGHAGSITPDPLLPGLSRERQSSGYSLPWGKSARRRAVPTSSWDRQRAEDEACRTCVCPGVSVVCLSPVARSTSSSPPWHKFSKLPFFSPGRALGLSTLLFPRGAGCGVLSLLCWDDRTGPRGSSLSSLSSWGAAPGRRAGRCCSSRGSRDRKGVSLPGSRHRKGVRVLPVPPS